MIRHLVRQIIKPGEYQQFVTDLRRLNEQAPSVGLPAYRGWVSHFGDMNEVFVEADYDGLDAHVSAWRSVPADSEFMTTFRSMISHIVPGTARDYPLSPVDTDS